MTQDLHILTGAPGTGKTAVLRQLTANIRRMDEPAREILAEHRISAGKDTPDIATDRFVENTLRRSILKYEQALEWAEPVVFDRGIPDCIAYALQLGEDPQPSIRAADAHRYNNDALILEPWEEIYSTDEERTMTFDQVLAFHRSIKEAYHVAGYTLVTVPAMPTRERGVFVSEFIGRE